MTWVFTKKGPDIDQDGSASGFEIATKKRASGSEFQSIVLAI